MKEQFNDLQKFYKWGFWTSLITICLFVDVCRKLIGQLSPNIKLDLNSISLIELTQFVIVASVIAGLSLVINFFFSAFYMQFWWWLKKNIKFFSDSGEVHLVSSRGKRSSPERLINISIKENNLPLYQYVKSHKAEYEKKEHSRFVMNFLFLFLAANFYLKGITYELTIGKLVMLDPEEIKQLIWVKYFIYIILFWFYQNAVYKRYDTPYDEGYIDESEVLSEKL